MAHRVCEGCVDTPNPVVALHVRALPTRGCDDADACLVSPLSRSILDVWLVMFVQR